MSIIEQAARRLDELRRSGIEVPSPGSRGVTPAARNVVRLPEAAPADPANDARLPPAGEAAPAAPAAPAQPAPPAPRSKEVHINLARLADMGYLTPETPRAQIGDEFRLIKRPLLQNAGGKGDTPPVDRGNLIMVTSSLPGEGKTFVSVNLAISIAMELDKTVLLVDADVSRPSVLSRLGIPPSRGLLDLLLDPSIEMSDVMLRTNIEKLTVLPAGSPNGRATELLASDSLNRLLDELARRYPDRIIIFDAPPLLPSTESRVLATHMGQVILVVEAERTEQDAVRQALGAIESCPVVLPLLNKASKSDAGFYYGYYEPEPSN